MTGAAVVDLALDGGGGCLSFDSPDSAEPFFDVEDSPLVPALDSLLDPSDPPFEPPDPPLDAPELPVEPPLEPPPDTFEPFVFDCP